MIIKPSAALRNSYTDVVTLCRQTQEPVFLTKNGEGDSVLMDLETFNRREEMLQLREELLKVEEARIHGVKGYTIEEVDKMLQKAIEEAEK